MKYYNWNDEIEKFLKNKEEYKKDIADDWSFAIGLQDVDGLQPSKYLIETVKDHIDGLIDIDEVKERIDSYYKELKIVNKSEEEADKVSCRIKELIDEKAFTFSITELFRIHKRLFESIIDDAGEIRHFNITKQEWVLDNDSVTYASYDNIDRLLEYDFNEEKKFSYKGLTVDESIAHLSVFISNIWQVHPFSEGNTRTIAVFLIKYLKTFGFDINNDLFSEKSWYFRNALVRANYNNIKLKVYEDISYLEKFLYNLLTNSNYELKNRYLHINNNENNVINNDIKDYSLEEQAIINMINENPFINQDEISIRIGKSLRTVKLYMSSMKQKGIIARLNGKKAGKWIIKKEVI